MNKNRMLVAVVLSISALASLSQAAAQTVTDKIGVINRTNTLLSQIPAQHQHLISSGLLRVQQVARVLNANHSKTGDAGTVTVSPKVATALAAAAPAVIAGPGPGGTTRVSDPSLDFGNSVMSSFTQSETSSARCGNTVVAGYNDSGAFARTAGVNYFGPWSFSSASYSTDGGRSFTESGFLNPGTNVNNFIAGDPVIACTSPTQFYYTSIFASSTDALGNFFNGVALNVSSDGGRTWGPPAAAVAKDLNHTIDKPWLAADPTNAQRLYVTYTDFDFSGFAGDLTCPNDIRYAIELVTSTDGGNTWTAPTVVHQECYFAGGFNSVQGSNPAVAADGTVYVGYEFFPGALPTNEIHLAKSTNHGQSISSDVKVSDLLPNGNFGLLQGGFRNNEFPQIAVDRSRGASRGTVYVTWTDGAANVVQDLPILFGTYAYPDVRVSSSVDGGQTFTAPATVSPVPASFTGRGRDQFFPGIAVDRHGTVGLCYYDRRQDPTNLVIDRYCSVSQNHGASWQEQQVSHARWAPSHYSDEVINATYIGDYDALTSDFLLQQSGFFGSFEVQTNGNPDVVGARFGGDE